MPIEKYKPCNFCNGRGKVGLDDKICPGCSGVGHLQYYDTYDCY